MCKDCANNFSDPGTANTCGIYQNAVRLGQTVRSPEGEVIARCEWFYKKHTLPVTICTICVNHDVDCETLFGKKLAVQSMPIAENGEVAEIITTCNKYDALSDDVSPFLMQVWQDCNERIVIPREVTYGYCPHNKPIENPEKRKFEW